VSVDHQDVPSLEDFERLVDAHLTRHMILLGYARLGASEGVNASGPLLMAAGSDRPRHRIGHSLFRLRRLLAGLGGRHRSPGPGTREYTMGYEALSQDAIALDPEDLLFCEEVWLSWDLTTGELGFALGMLLPELIRRHGTPEDAHAILSPEQPLQSRLEHLGTVVERLVRSRMPD
jgi:hypothetical protein